MSIKLYVTLFIAIFSFALFLSCSIIYQTIKERCKIQLKLNLSREQMLLSEKRIATFLTDHSLKPGASIEQIGQALDIVDGGVEIGVAGKAQLLVSDGKKVVTYKRGQTPIERRFDFAHECGHCINGDHLPAMRSTEWTSSEVEQLADYVGTALLMPLDSVYNDLCESSYSNASQHQQISIIQKLSIKYGVNQVTALRRVKEVYELKTLE